MTAVYVAWLLLAFALFAYASRVMIADLLDGDPGSGGSWPCADLDCDCCEVVDA